MATSISDGGSLHWGDGLVIAAYFAISIGVGVWVRTLTFNFIKYFHENKTLLLYGRQ